MKPKEREKNTRIGLYEPTMDITTPATPVSTYLNFLTFNSHLLVMVRFTSVSQAVDYSFRVLHVRSVGSSSCNIQRKLENKEAASQLTYWEN